MHEPDPEGSAAGFDAGCVHLEAMSMREQPALRSAMQSAVPLHRLPGMSCMHGAKAAACAEGCTCCLGHLLSEFENMGQVVDLCASLIGALSEVRLGKVADHFFTVRARSCAFGLQET